MKYDGYQVGIVIKSLRIQRNLTKEALATELGISESTIKKYENGERALSITNLFKIPTSLMLISPPRTLPAHILLLEIGRAHV